MDEHSTDVMPGTLDMLILKTRIFRGHAKHGATTFTDYFVLHKVDGKRLIANKM